MGAVEKLYGSNSKFKQQIQAQNQNLKPET